MKLLVLGGTVFLGRHMVSAALSNGHNVTLFNRGRDNPDLFPEAERLRGDRDNDLDALKGKRWDAVIDTCGYVPRHVRDSAQLLSQSVDHYTFISTLGVYSDYTKRGIDETAEVGTFEDETIEEVNEQTYGPLKALCEREVQRAMPARALVVRAGLIVGSYDPLDRFTYWVRRVARGGEMLAPGTFDRRIQIIDVRDLSEWIIRIVESRATGVYNATGPDYPLSMGRLLEESKSVTGSDATFVWVSDSFLIENKVGSWNEVPLWLPEDVKYAGFMYFDCSKAVGAGLSYRPLSETIRDTLEWDTSRSEPIAPYKMMGIELPPTGIKPERESELLEAFKRRG